MNTPVAAVLDDDSVARPVVLVLVRVCPFPSFQHDGIVIDVHEASLDEHIVTHVDIYGVRAWRATFWLWLIDTLCRGIYVAVKVSHSLAAVQMVCPERALSLRFADFVPLDWS